MSKTLHVARTSWEELCRKWKMAVLPKAFRSEILYIRCNSTGGINWDIAPVYTHIELIERNNVKIIKR